MHVPDGRPVPGPIAVLALVIAYCIAAFGIPLGPVGTVGVAAAVVGAVVFRGVSLPSRVLTAAAAALVALIVVRVAIEEAPALGRPVLVLRNTPERPEAVDEGVSRLVGTDPDAIARAALRLLDDPEEYAAMARVVSPFGDGHAARRIGDILESRAVALTALAHLNRP